MKELFDKSSYQISKVVTNTYSTSFSYAVMMLDKRIRKHIYAIYGFVRYADEIVDTFHDYPKKEMFYEFKEEFYKALNRGISMNPILNSFILTVKKYDIDLDLIEAFLDSMERDLYKNNYTTYEEFKEYIYGSADVVGLMCLQVFVGGDKKKYNELKPYAEKLGSAFQKVNFLRDLKDDVNKLNRSYFPNVDFANITPEQKQQIIQEIKDDFTIAYEGIKRLPKEALFGVYTAYLLYQRLLLKIERSNTQDLLKKRFSVNNVYKIWLIIKSYFSVKFNLI
jgi:phytoene/squalene synthetase